MIKKHLDSEFSILSLCFFVIFESNQSISEKEIAAGLHCDGQFCTDF